MVSLPVGTQMNVGNLPVNIVFSSHRNYALGVHPAPVFFKASTIRNSSESCRLSSSEVLARLKVAATQRSVR
jgi:hypothetical protein